MRLPHVLLLAMLLTAPAWAADPGLSRAAFDYNTLGDHTVIAGVANKSLAIYQLDIWCNGINNLTLKDSTPATLHGQMDFAASQGMLFPFHEGLPYWVAGTGKDVVLNLSAALQCTGTFWYKA